MLTSKQLEQLVSRGEGLNLDLKRDLSDEVYQDMTKDFAAFANTEGGTILVGVTNAREVVGVRTEPGAISRIYQEASYCVPPVTINAYEQVLRKARLIIIEIPKSTYIHCDKKRRFPQRFGDRIDFMETQMILSLAKSRRLVSEGEGSNQTEILTIPRVNQVWVPPPTKPPTRDDRETVALLSHLNVAVRIAAVQDLYSRTDRRQIEKVPGFWNAIYNRLSDDSPEVRRWTTNLIHSLADGVRRKPIGMIPKRILKKVPELAVNDADLSVRHSAFQLMCLTGRPEFLRAILKVFLTTPKENFAGLNPQQNLSHLSKAMLHNLKKKFYSELGATQDKDVQARVLDLLQDLRYVYSNSR